MAAGEKLRCPKCGAPLGLRLDVPVTFAFHFGPDADELLIGEVLEAGGPRAGDYIEDAVESRHDHLRLGEDARRPLVVCEGDPAHTFSYEEELGRIVQRQVRG